MGAAEDVNGKRRGWYTIRISYVVKVVSQSECRGSCWISHPLGIPQSGDKLEQGWRHSLVIVWTLLTTSIRVSVCLFGAVGSVNWLWPVCSWW